MTTQKVKIDVGARAASYEISIGGDLLATSGKWARRCLGTGAKKIVIVSNPKVFKLYGELAVESIGKAGFTVSHVLIGDGERYKNLGSVDAVLKAFGAAGLARTDAVMALGGGVVGDLAGFAAAIYLRGIAFLQVPTTLLSMIDSSVGGKTGVNSAYGKNLTGAFHQPAGVLIDTSSLATLPRRELAAGFCEAIKQGAIGGKKLLDQTATFLAACPPAGLAAAVDGSDVSSAISDLIASQVAFKAGIVAGDERESASRVDGRSRKILNFGHTLAHALEKVTAYKYFKHGEAVGYGILFAAAVSNSLALLHSKDVKLLNDVVHRVGPLPPLADIDPHEVIEAFKFDKKQLSGGLEMVLLKGIGKPVIVTERDIPTNTIKTVLRDLLS